MNEPKLVRILLAGDVVKAYTQGECPRRRACRSLTGKPCPDFVRLVQLETGLFSECKADRNQTSKALAPVRVRLAIPQDDGLPSLERRAMDVVEAFDEWIEETPLCDCHPEEPGECPACERRMTLMSAIEEIRPVVVYDRESQPEQKA